MGIKIALEWACLRVNKKNHHGVITEMVLHLSIVLLTLTKSSRFFPHRENRMLILIQTNNNLSNIGTVTTASGIYTTAEWAVGTNTAVLTLPSDGNYILLMTYELQTPTDETCSMYAQMQIRANRAILPFGKTNFVSFYHKGITQGYDSRIAYEGVCVAINAKKGDTIIPYVHTDKSNVAFNVNIIAMRV